MSSFTIRPSACSSQLPVPLPALPNCLSCHYMQALAARAERFTGADCAALVREAGLAALQVRCCILFLTVQSTDVAWQDLIPFCSALCFWCVREAACFCRIPLGLAGFHWHKRTCLLLCSDEGFSTCAGESRSTTRGGAPLRGGVRARHAQRAAISGDGGDLSALPPPRRQPAGGVNPLLSRHEGDSPAPPSAATAAACPQRGGVGLVAAVHSSKTSGSTPAAAAACVALPLERKRLLSPRTLEFNHPQADTQVRS